MTVNKGAEQRTGVRRRGAALEHHARGPRVAQVANRPPDDVGQLVGGQAGGWLDVDHHPVWVGASGRRPPGVDLGERGTEIVRRRGGVEDHAVGQRARQAQGLRAARPEQERRWLHGRPVERDTVQVHVAAVDVDTVTVQEVAHCGGVLAQQRQRRLHPGSHLTHPEKQSSHSHSSATRGEAGRVA
jgi:hypothetical protein